MNPSSGMNTQQQQYGNTMNQGMPNPQQQDPFSAISQQAQQNAPPVSKDQIQEMVDETVEKIIEEKWEKVVNDVQKVVKWKDEQERQINLLKEDITQIKDQFEKLEKKLVNKVNEYDKDLLNVSSEIKGLEKVFQKITPTLVNNVNELSKITKNMKGESLNQESMITNPENEKTSDSSSSQKQEKDSQSDS